MTIWTCLPTPLRPGDVGLAAAAGIACALAARAAGPAGASADEVFLDGRRTPWWAAGVALVSSEFTGLTLLAVPAAAYSGGWGFAHLFIGSLAGRFGSAWLLPRQRASRALTVYGAARPQAGEAAAMAGAALFCIARALSSALKLFAGALALAWLSGLGPGWWAILLCAAGTAVAGYGGLRGVIWTAAVQCGVLLLAAAALPFYTIHQVPGALHGVLNSAAEAGRLTFSDAGAFWRAWPLGAIGALAGFSADHELAQKLLCCRTDNDAKRALIVSAAGSGTLLLLLLATGTCLVAFYSAHPALAVPDHLDEILTHFSATVLPSPLRGLVLSAVFMAAMDVPVSALSAVGWADLANGGLTLPARSRWALAGAWGVTLLGLAFLLVRFPAGTVLGALGWPAVAGLLLVLCGGAALRRPGSPLMLAAMGAALAAAGLLERSARPVDPGWLTAAGAAVGTAVLFGAAREP